MISLLKLNTFITINNNFLFSSNSYSFFVSICNSYSFIDNQKHTISNVSIFARFLFKHLHFELEWLSDKMTLPQFNRPNINRTELNLLEYVTSSIKHYIIFWYSFSMDFVLLFCFFFRSQFFFCFFFIHSHLSKFVFVLKNGWF